MIIVQYWQISGKNHERIKKKCVVFTCMALNDELVPWFCDIRLPARSNECHENLRVRTYPANLSWSKATLNKAVRPYFPGGVALRGALKIPWTSNCRSYPTFFHMHVFFKILGAKDVKISLWLLQKETYCPPWTQIEATFDLGLENLAIFTPPQKVMTRPEKRRLRLKIKQPAPQMNFSGCCHRCW